ncbi:class I SAM-dependent methyltransferase [Methanonatronarchaeum sp. AMET6-2]|uniref:class I SAM-dependent methyltransferase n=1 Tax=Methanonatronarchaeum sp. AMET6-2 TaxID=2933293 RepID=UPI0011FF01C5|nr:class I SAM-dependent methyltransferase [Methanonatronarchaeum sp. AMET6-2]RZN61778.1 MAG: class I SAM-dependent methyltransferase [Methanonatronarchaeia archaeon]UOY09366.1 class I SAM-dependent methyltransferase [Methanonatronarchaeum sp. AMET6-2]
MNDGNKEHADRFDEIAGSYDEEQENACGGRYVESVENVVRCADPSTGDVVLDLGVGTGAVALRLADKAGFVYGRDISEGMLDKAREKAFENQVDNIDFKTGSFLEPNVDGEVDIVVTNFAMHHLSDSDKKLAIKRFRDMGARKIVIGDLMFFRPPDPDNLLHKPDVDNPAYVSVLVKGLTEAGYAVTRLIEIHRELGVVVGEDMGGQH